MEGEFRLVEKERELTLLSISNGREAHDARNLLAAEVMERGDRGNLNNIQTEDA